MIGPGLAKLDMGLLKNTPLTEKLNLQFRFETFNLLNRANFDLPNAGMFDSSGSLLPSVGSITGTVTSSRQLQFGMKIVF